MQDTKVRKRDLALPENQALYEDENGCPFAAPQKPKKVTQPVAPMTEIEFMDAELDALRLGLVEPMVRLTPAEMEEIEEERIGAKFSESPYQW